MINLNYNLGKKMTLREILSMVKNKYLAIAILGSIIFGISSYDFFRAQFTDYKFNQSLRREYKVVELPEIAESLFLQVSNIQIKKYFQDSNDLFQNIHVSITQGGSNICVAGNVFKKKIFLNIDSTSQLINENPNFFTNFEDQYFEESLRVLDLISVILRIQRQVDAEPILETQNIDLAVQNESMEKDSSYYLLTQLKTNHFAELNYKEIAKIKVAINNFFKINKLEFSKIDSFNSIEAYFFKVLENESVNRIVLEGIKKILSGQLSIQEKWRNSNKGSVLKFSIGKESNSSFIAKMLFSVLSAVVGAIAFASLWGILVNIMTNKRQDKIHEK